MRILKCLNHVHKKKHKALLFVILLLVITCCGYVTRKVFAAPSKVGLGAVLTKTSDGSAPFPAIDPNGNNNLVATYDTTSYTFDVSVNTLDAAPHTVTNVNIVATLTSTTSEVTWLRSSLPGFCGADSAVSVDGKTISCIVAGPINTGTTLNISAAWLAQGGVPNNTDVTVQFTVSATDPSPDNDPIPAVSNTSLVTVVTSGMANYEVRKIGTSTTIVRDVSGNPTFLDVKWGLQVEIKPPDPNQLKGVSTSALGDLNFIDDLQLPADSTQLPLSSVGTLLSCDPSGSAVVPISSSVYPNQDAVENSGTWTCSQPGGTGTNIAISATGIDWSPRWFPGRWGGSAATNFAFNDGTSPNEQYNVPSGQNNIARVATQEINIRYPFNNVVAFDQTAGDKNLSSGLISWCNEIDNISVVGGPAGIDTTSNNVVCVTFNNQTIPGSVQKYFVSPRVNASPGVDIGIDQGILGYSAYDDYVEPGQVFMVRNTFETHSVSVSSISPVLCDSIENDQYTLHPHVAPSYSVYPNQYNMSNYTWGHRNNIAGFPALTSGDVLVEFANAGIFANNNAQRNINCDDPSLVWQTDPNLVSGGYAGVNLIRTTLLKPVPPAQAIYVMYTVRANSGLSAGTILRNFYQYKNTISGVTGSWNRSPSTCNQEVNLSTIATCGTNLVDRAIILDAVGNISLRDNPLAIYGDTAGNVTAGQDWTYTIRAGMSSLTNKNVTDVNVYNVLPPGLSYKSSTVTPDLVIPDCNANINPSCVSVPANRTNMGYTTIKWDRGDFNYVAPMSAPFTNNTLFGTWNVTVGTGYFAPNAVEIGAFTWVTGNGITTKPNPITFESVSGNRDDDLAGPSDEDFIRIDNANAFSIEKYIVEDREPFGDRVGETSLNGVIKYDLAYGNSSGSAKTMDAIDILPYVGDGRLPATVIDGDYSVSSVTATVNPGLLNQIYITGASPATLNDDPLHATNTGVNAVGVPGGIWTCTFAQAGLPGCPTSNNITGLRIVSNNITVGQWGMIRVNLQTIDNDGAEYYTNRFKARATGLALPVNSSDVTAKTLCLRLGNRLFLDIDRNGTFNVGDTGLDNVDLELVSVGGDNSIGGVDDTIVKTTTTSGGGLYKFDCFVEGDYYVRIATTESVLGGDIYGLLVAGNSSINPNDNVDDDNNHNLILDGNTFRTNAITMNFGSEPLGELGNHIDVDSNDNLTLDMGLMRPFDVSLDKTIDGNSDNVFSKLEYIAAPGVGGNPDPTMFQYKFTVSSPSYAETSNGVVMTDIIRPGVNIVSVASITQGLVTTSFPLTGASMTGSPLVWEIGSVSPGSVATLVLNATVNNSNLANFASGFADGVSRNISQITAMTESDVDSTPNNVVIYNPVTHEDDESDAAVTIPPLLGDKIWNDTNADGDQDPGELGIAGVTVRLYQDTDGTPGPSSGDTLIGSQPSNMDGYWMFGGLAAGVNFYASLDPNTIPAGFINSPRFSVVDINIDNNSNDTFVSDMHTLTPGEINLSVDFGLHPKIDLGNTVFYDINNNGIKDPLETGIQNVTVQLFAASDVGFTTVLSTKVTDINGNYLFEDLESGDYRVRIPNIAGDTGRQFFSSTGNYEPAPDPDNDIDGDDSGTSSGGAVVSDIITLSYNGEPINDGDSNTYTNLSLDFGFSTVYSVGNRVFVDLNGNGVFDGSDTGFTQPVLVRLLNPDLSEYDSDPITPGVQALSEMSDTNGYYSFDDIIAGDYVAEVTIPAGYKSTVDTINTSSPNTSLNNYDRGVGQASGVVVSGVFTLGPLGGEPTGDEDVATATSNSLLPDSHRNMTIDFGVVPPFDLKLTKSVVGSGPFYATGNADYKILVENIGPGPSQPGIKVVDRLPAGVTYQSVSSPGSNWSCVDASGEITCQRDISSSPLAGGTQDELTITVKVDFGQTSASAYRNVARVEIATSELNDEVIPIGSSDSGFETGDNTVDSNNDSSADFNILTYTVGDRVFLDIDNNGVQDPTDWPIAGIAVDIESPGPDNDYLTTGDNLTFNTTTDNDGMYQFTSLPYSQYRVRVSGVPAGFTQVYDVDGLNDNESIALFADPSVTNDLTHDFGYVGDSSIGDYVWWDVNGDQVQDASEPALEDVDVVLTWAGPDNDLSTTADNKTISTMTDSSGKYLFDNLTTGTYKVSVTPKAPTSNLTTANQDMLVVLLSNEQRLDIDFGFDDQGTIGDIVFLDVNNNGKKEQDEPGIEGVILELYLDRDGNGVIDPTDSSIRQKITDTNGKYLFTNLLLDDGISGNDGTNPNSASYIVRVAGIETSSKYFKYWEKLKHVLGNVGVDNEGQNIFGFGVVLGATTQKYLAADFGYYNKDVVGELYPVAATPLSNTGHSIILSVFVSVVLFIVLYNFRFSRSKYH